MTFLDTLKSIGGLVHYYELDDKSRAKDLVGHVDGRVHGNVRFAADGAHFDGRSWIELPDDPGFSPGPTKEFTQIHFFKVDDWHRQSHNGEYVHYMGKGSSGRHEWTCRYYIDGGRGEASSRRRRTSFYSFNPQGGLGAGSYVQDANASNHERMMAGVIYAKGGGRHPGVTRQYQNGVKKDEDRLSGYNITPRHTSAPVGLGSRGDNTGFLVGRMRRVAFFNRALSDGEIRRIFDARDQSGAAAPPPTVVGQVTINGQTHAINAVNADRDSNQLVAYNVQYGGSTETNEWGTEVVVLNGHVIEVREKVGNTNIPVGGAVLSGHGTAREWLSEHAKVGMVVDLPESIVPKPHPPAEEPHPTRVDSGGARTAEAAELRKQATELRRVADGLDVIAAHLGG